MSAKECVAAPAAATRNPEPKQVAAANIALRGPAVSSHRPNRAAESPSTAMANEMNSPSSVRFHAATSATFSASSGFLKILNAYTCPIARWMESAAGGTSHRLKPGGATETSRSRNDSIRIPQMAEFKPINQDRPDSFAAQLLSTG